VTIFLKRSIWYTMGSKDARTFYLVLKELGDQVSEFFDKRQGSKGL
jgi:hypothetical protein